MRNQNFSRHIFLADDDSDDREIFAEALSEIASSAILTQAVDGLDLMTQLYVPPVPLPDIVFLDLNMPRKSGMDCLKAIREDQNGLQDLKIVILTTSSGFKDIEEAYKLGASLFATKPSSFASLKEMIRSILQKDWSQQPARNSRTSQFVIS